MFTPSIYKITERQILIAILILASILRFWGLGSAEIFHDEGFYAFRSIGYLDYLQNDDQTTPVQWFKDASLPWWTRLSFHDHPPFYFLIQNLFFRIFGDSLLVARLPSLLSGLGSVFLVYLLGRKLFKNELAGLLGAVLLGVNHIHIWISRSSLMESLLVFLVLANLYYFLEFLNDQRHWKMWGITLGLAFLTKYTSFFLVPVYLSYLVFRRRLLFKDWRLYAALGLALILFSPVLIYNFYLYKTVGHFDLQFAYLFNQETPEWRASAGKIQEPFSNLILNLSAMYSLPFLLASGFGLVLSLVWQKEDKNPNLLILGWLFFIFLTLMLISVGSAFRFIVLYIMPFLLFSGIAFYTLINLIPYKYFVALLVIFLIYEVYFSVDGLFFTFPDNGVANLDFYLEEVFNRRRSKILPVSLNPHLDQVIQNFGFQYPPAQESLVIVYDENIALASRLWPFTRRLYYRGILAVTAGQFRNLLRQRGLEAFQNSRIIFIKATENTSLNPFLKIVDAAELEGFLKSNFQLKPEKIIYGKNDLPMFLVYRFLL